MIRPLDIALATWGTWLGRHAVAAVVVCVGLSMMAATGLARVEFETHAERFLSGDHPKRIRYEAFKQEFGLDTAIFVLLETSDVFALDFLAQLDRLHHALAEKVPWVEEVQSLANARDIHVSGDRLEVRDLLHRLPRTVSEANALAERVFATRAYRDHLVSSDRRVTTLALRLSAYPDPVRSNVVPEEDLNLLEAEFAPSGEDGFDQSAQDSTDAAAALSASQAREAVRIVREITRASMPDSVSISFAGNPVVNEHLGEALKRDLGLLTSIAIVAIAVCLVGLFRRLSAVVLPLGVVMLSVLGTFGIAGLVGMPLNVSAQILPPLLLATGVSNSIHLLVIFYREFDAERSAKDAMIAALVHAGPATLLTGLTTALGLASFVVATDMAPAHSLGIFAPIGIAIGLLLGLVMLPALLVLLPLRRCLRGPDHDATRSLGRLLICIGRSSGRHPGLVLGVTSLLFAASIAGVLRLEADNDALEYFPANDPVRAATLKFDSALSGSMAMEVLIDTGQENGLHDPAMIRALDSLGVAATRVESIEGARLGKVLSIADILRETHSALGGDTAESPLPTTRAAIAQELLVFEAAGSGELERLVRSDYSMARVSVRGPWLPGNQYREWIPRIEASLRAVVPPGTRIETTGLIPLFAEAVAAISRAFIQSYAMAVCAIGLAMIVFIGSLRGGLASMLPNVLPVFLVLGLMGWCGVDLDLFTMLIGSIGIGLAVDDTIHLCFALRRFYDEAPNLEHALEKALETTGSAIFTSTIVLGIGFASFLLSSMANLVVFGILTALCVALALAADVILLPAIASWILSARGRGRDPADVQHPAIQPRPGLASQPASRPLDHPL